MFRNRTTLLNTLFSLFISQLIFWLVFLNFESLPPKIPLWFMQTTTTIELVDKIWAWLLPGLAVGILAVNLITTALIYQKRPFLVNLVMTNSTLTNLFLLLISFNLLNRMLGWL